MTVVRVYLWIIKIGLSLAMLGHLKTCTFTVTGVAADERVSYMATVEENRGAVFAK